MLALESMPGREGATSLRGANAQRSMMENLRRLVAARDLLYTWTIREFKVRYAGSLLGFAWALLYPLGLLLVLMLVFSWFLGVSTAGIPAGPFIYCGLAAWLFSSGAIQNSAFALLANLNLVKNAAFPREVLPLATVIVGCVDFVISAVLMCGLMAYYRLPLSLPMLFLPVLVAIQTSLTLAICLYVAAKVVFYRDFRFLVPIGLQFWMYLSPVFYPLEMVPARVRGWYLLNPMAALIDSYRRVILFRQWPDWRPLSVAAVISIAAMCLAYGSFKRAEWGFSDRD